MKYTTEMDDNNNNNKYLEIKGTGDFYQGQKREIICKKQNFFFKILLLQILLWQKWNLYLLQCEKTLHDICRYTYNTFSQTEASKR